MNYILKNNSPFLFLLVPAALLLLSLLYTSCGCSKHLSKVGINAKREVITSGVQAGKNMENTKIEIILPANDSIQILKLYSKGKEEIKLTHYIDKETRLSSTFNYKNHYKNSFTLSSSVPGSSDNYEKVLFLDVVYKGKKCTKKMMVDTKFINGK